MCHSYKSHIDYYLNKHTGQISGVRSAKCLICYSPANQKGAVNLYALLTEKSKILQEESIQYLYYNKPLISFISPMFGKQTGGTTIEIIGNDFQNYGKFLQCSIGIYFVIARFISSKRIICL